MSRESEGKRRSQGTKLRKGGAASSRVLRAAGPPDLTVPGAESRTASEKSDREKKREIVTGQFPIFQKIETLCEVARN